MRWWEFGCRFSLLGFVREKWKTLSMDCADSKFSWHHHKFSGNSVSSFPFESCVNSVPRVQYKIWSSSRWLIVAVWTHWNPATEFVHCYLVLQSLDCVHGHFSLLQHLYWSLSEVVRTRLWISHFWLFDLQWCQNYVASIFSCLHC